MPLGTIARLVKKDSNMGPVSVGCLNSLYKSLEDLDKNCLWTETSKEMLLQPTNSSENYCSSLKFNIDDTPPTKYFICSMLHVCGFCYFTTSSNILCQCGNPISRSVSFKHFCKGFVNDIATFVITDDLNIFPNDMFYTSFDLLHNSGIKSISSIDKITLNITKEKVLDLLKCSLLSKSPLTDLFLKKKISYSSPEKSLFSCPGFESNSNIHITLNLIIRKSDGKVLYAQVQKDFVDLILSFLTFPLGGVARILRGNFSLGCIDALYKSIVELDKNKYLVSKDAKDRLVDPHVASLFKLSKILPLQIDRTSTYYFCYYRGESFKQSITDNQFFISDECRASEGKTKALKLIKPKSATGSHSSYVKGPVMYVVTDDLFFSPLSVITALYLIDSLKTPFNDVKEKVVTIGINECLGILKASLTSTSALTNGLRHLITDVKEEK
ncbi:uncharacterized protein LOC131641765 [Vicia villosa]|uniref:uncharacterized protein LOC131641765 n=1 Tax=Vicia villosa TaxID=3911 RepID=UPI00273BB44C|nr:uncharacterized protein LOC131641765 [Vicia villosa]